MVILLCHIDYVCFLGKTCAIKSWKLNIWDIQYRINKYDSRYLHIACDFYRIKFQSALYQETLQPPHTKVSSIKVNAELQMASSLTS